MQTKTFTASKAKPLAFSESPTDLELTTARIFWSPLIAMEREPVAGENAALAKALLAFKEKSNLDDIGDLTNFLDSFPNSRWRASLECILGEIRLETGYFTQALLLWKSSWEVAKDETNLKTRSIADESISRMIGLYGRLGEEDILAKHLREIKGRKFYGSVDARVQGAKTQLAQMRARPEVCFKCGPAALHVLAQLDPRLKENARKIIGNAHSTDKGTNLSQISNWAKDIGFDYIAAKRTNSAPFVDKCLVHWRVGHFAAIIAREGDLFTIKDLTFGSNGVFKVSEKALEAESDGYFLIPKNTLQNGWIPLDDTEALTIWGKGISPGRGNAQTPSCPKSPSNSPGCGMAQAAAFSMQASLTITDIPLSYQPPVGSTIDFLANYNYLTVGQPSPGSFTFSNLGPNWSLNWVSFVQAASPSTNPSATVFVRGGGSEVYEAANPYSHDVYSQALLIAGTDYFQRNLPDGSIEIFSAYDGIENYFLTSVLDPQGNATIVNYDDTFRVTTVVDCFGQASTFEYGSDTAGDDGYYTITKITDPFGRKAVFQYDATFTNLLKIVDQIGMESSFVYSQTVASFISTMTTPYGQSNFEIYTPSTTAVGLKTTLPDGSVTQIESWIDIEMKTYYWDRWALTLYPSDPANGDYSHCVTTHWIGEPITEIMSAVPFWVQPPLDYTIWYMYNDCYWNGYAPAPDHFWLGDQTINKPIQILRTVPKSMPPSLESLQTWTYSYGADPKSNSFGFPIQIQDPMPAARVFNFAFSDENIDLLSTQTSSGEIISQATYDEQHRPITKIDSSGTVTSIIYNEYGQPLTVTDADDNTTRCSYSAQAFVLNGSVSPNNNETITITIYNSVLTGSSKIVSYSVLESDSLTDIAMELSRAINSDQDLRLAGITATWVPTQPIGKSPAVYVNSFAVSETTYEVATTGEDSVTIALSLPFGYLMRVEGPLGELNITSFTYDAVGRLHSTTNSEGYTLTYTYDDMDRLLVLTYPDGSTERTEWYRLDAVATYDRLGNAHQYYFDSLDQLAYEINSLGQRITYKHCRCGGVSEVIDPKGNVTKWSYDLQGRLVTKTYADLTTINFTYDLLGRVATKIDALGQKTTFDYNQDNSISNISYSACINQTPTVEFSYDPNFPRVSRASNYLVDSEAPISDYQYSYNPCVSNATNCAFFYVSGLPQTPNAADTIDVKFYNAGLSGGEFSLPTYSVRSDDKGAPEQVAMDLAATINANANLTSAGIAASANRTLITISAESNITLELSSTGSTIVTTGGGGMISSLSDAASSNSTISYSYDLYGRTIVRMINGGNNATKWTYDTLGRIVAEENTLGIFSYAYKNDASEKSHGDLRLATIIYPNGQKTQMDYHSNFLDERLKQINNLNFDGSTLSQFDYSYDLNGRITSWPKLQANGSRFQKFDYDRVGQLIGAQTTGGDSLASHAKLAELSYAYDGSNNRTSMQTSTSVLILVSGSITADDTVSLTIKNSNLSSGFETVEYSVQSDDSLNDIALGLSYAINVNSDLRDVGVSATPLGATLTLKSVAPNSTTYEATSSVGVTEILVVGVTENFATHAVIHGFDSTGDILTITVFDITLVNGYESVSYTVGTSDTLSTIASALSANINSNAALSTLGVFATVIGTVITLRSASRNATTYGYTASSDSTEIITFSTNLNEVKLIGIKGFATSGDILSLYVYDSNLTGGNENISYAVNTDDNLTSIAAAIASRINQSQNLSSIGISASAQDNLISIQSNSTSVTSYRQAVNNGATEQIVLNVPENGTQTAALEGLVTVGDTLHLKIFDDTLSNGTVTISYTVTTGDTLVNIAAALASSINNNSELTSAKINAFSTKEILYIVSDSMSLTTYNQAVNPGATESIVLNPSFGLNRTVYNNVNESIAHLPGGEARFKGLTNKPVNSVTISSGTVNLTYTPMSQPSYAVSEDATSALSLSALVNGQGTVTVGGPSITVSTIDADLPGGQASVQYFVQSSDNFASIASNVSDAINASEELASIGIKAVSNGDTIELSVDEPTWAVSVSDNATEILTLSANILGSVTLTVGGTVTTGDVLTISTENVALPGGVKTNTYTVLIGDTLNSIAQAIATVLDADSELKRIGISVSGPSLLDLAWSESFAGSALLAEEANSVIITVAAPDSQSASTNLELLVKGLPPVSCEFDLNGNLSNDGTNFYQWDAENRLVQISYPGDLQVTKFQYDSLGRRKIISEYSSGVLSSTKKFIWCGTHLRESRDADDDVISQWFSLGQTIASNNYFYTCDHLASVHTLTDVSGTVQGEYSLSPYGEVSQLQGTMLPDFLFADTYFHQKSQLHLAMHRAYNPQTANWLSRDLLTRGGSSEYSYAAGDPISLRDPSGLEPEIYIIWTPLWVPFTYHGDIVVRDGENWTAYSGVATGGNSITHNGGRLTIGVTQGTNFTKDWSPDGKHPNNVQQIIHPQPGLSSGELATNISVIARTNSIEYFPTTGTNRRYDPVFRNSNAVVSRILHLAGLVIPRPKAPVIAPGLNGSGGGINWPPGDFYPIPIIITPGLDPDPKPNPDPCPDKKKPPRKPGGHSGPCMIC